MRGAVLTKDHFVISPDPDRSAEAEGKAWNQMKLLTINKLITCYRQRFSTNRNQWLLFFS